MHTRSDDLETIYTEERCFITELVNDPGHPEASVALCRVAPGVLTQRHSLSVREWYLVQSGQGEMHLGDAAPFLIGPGDVVAIPAGTSQQVRNTGSDDLCFQCLCLPRFTPDCYTVLE
ncbi:MAG: cupin domain-containing protein [Pseudomonadota bacterium]